MFQPNTLLNIALLSAYKNKLDTSDIPPIFQVINMQIALEYNNKELIIELVKDPELERFLKGEINLDENIVFIICFDQKNIKFLLFLIKNNYLDLDEWYKLFFEYSYISTNIQYLKFIVTKYFTFSENNLDLSKLIKSSIKELHNFALNFIDRNGEFLTLNLLKNCLSDIFYTIDFTRIIEDIIC